MILDPAAFTNLINLGVTIGTFALGILTVYLLIRQRRSSQARELADRVYIPLRREVASWSSPEEVYGGVTSKAWKELKENVPYLIQSIPHDLADLLDKVESSFPRVNFLAIQVRRMIIDETNRLALPLRDQSTGNEYTMIRQKSKLQ